MSKQELSRRKVLAGLATAGTAGGLVSGGAASVLSDRETFTNNSVQASATVSGEMHLDVDLTSIEKEVDLSHIFDTEDESIANNENVANNSPPELDTFEKRIPVWRVRLPDEEANNPALVWLRLTSCPEPTVLAKHIWVKLYVDCGHREEILVIGNLFDVADRLRRGFPLDPNCFTDTPGHQDCFEPGEEIRVILDWRIDPFFHGEGGQLPLPFEFNARQCRYNDGTENPFPDLPSCEDEPDSPRKSISFLAFCSDDGEPNPEISKVLEQDEDGPTAVKWETEANVTYVVLKAGNTMTIYDYSDESHTTSGVAASGDENAEIPAYDDQPGEASIPCDVAERLLTENEEFSGTAVKLGDDEGITDD